MVVRKQQVGSNLQVAAPSGSALARRRALTLDAGFHLKSRAVILEMIASATLVTAAAVSITGTIGWIGLIIPDIARLLVGPDFPKLLAASMMLGASYLLILDMLARSIALVEIPLGILTAAVGAPIFIWLLASGRRGWE